MHSLLHKQFKEQGLTDDPARVSDEDYYPVPCDDEPIQSFTDRMLKDPELFADHISDAIFGTDDACVKIQARIGILHDYSHSPAHQQEAFRQLGEHLYKLFLDHCKNIENET